MSHSQKSLSLIACKCFILELSAICYPAEGLGRLRWWGQFWRWVRKLAEPYTRSEPAAEQAAADGPAPHPSGQISAQSARTKNCPCKMDVSFAYSCITSLATEDGFSSDGSSKTMLSCSKTCDLLVEAKLAWAKENFILNPLSSFVCSIARILLAQVCECLIYSILHFSMQDPAKHPFNIYFADSSLKVGPESWRLPA